MLLASLPLKPVDHTVDPVMTQDAAGLDNRNRFNQGHFHNG